MLHDALDITDGPVAIRWPKTAARQVGRERGRPRARRPAALRAGDDVCIIAVGKMLDAAEAAAELLAADGVSVTLWDARVVKPLDPDMLADAGRHPLVVTVEDGLRDGGVGIGHRRPVVRAHRRARREPRVRVLGVPDRLHPPRQARRHPRRARPRRRRHLRLGRVADGGRPPARRLGLTQP